MMLAAYEYYHNKNLLRVNRRTLRDMLDPFDMPVERLASKFELYIEFESCFRFRKMYRLPRCLTLDFLDILKEYKVFDNACPDIPLTVQFCSVLNFYASGSYQRRDGSDSFASIRQTCVSRCVRSISRIIGTQIIDRFVKFPTTLEEIGVGSRVPRNV